MSLNKVWTRVLVAMLDTRYAEDAADAAETNPTPNESRSDS